MPPPRVGKIKDLTGRTCVKELKSVMENRELLS
jgi:hypothetical protein